MKIDLHMHSSNSLDGEFSPRELVRMCKEKGIDTMAVTDHNTVSGVDEALEWGEKLGVEVIPAVELDTMFDGKVFHMVGYFIDHRDPAFQELDDSILELENRAFPVMIEKLNGMGFFLTWEEMVERLSPGELPSEELMANIIFEKPENRELEIVKPYLSGGERSAMPQFYFYKDFLAPGKEGFTPRDYINLEEAAELVRRTGGVPIVAHPVGNIAGDWSLFDKLAQTGVAGFEAFSSYHSPEEKQRVLEICKDKGCLFTCGSDFHGRMKKAIHLGDHGCTEDQTEIYKALKAARRLNKISV